LILLYDFTIGELLKTGKILRNFDEFETFARIIDERQMQDMKSAYVEIRENVVHAKQEEFTIDFSDVEFQIDLLKTDEINLNYILSLILEKAKESEDVENLQIVDILDCSSHLFDKEAPERISTGERLAHLNSLLLR